MVLVHALISILLLLCQPGALSTAPARTPAAATSAPPEMRAPHERRARAISSPGTTHQCPSVISVAKLFGLTRAAAPRGNPSRSSLFSNSALVGAFGGLPASELGLRPPTAGPLFSYSARVASTARHAPIPASSDHPSRPALFSNSALDTAPDGVPDSVLPNSTARPSGWPSISPLFSYSAFKHAGSTVPARASAHRHAGAHSLARSPGGSLFTYSTSPVRVCHLLPFANSPRGSLFTNSTAPPAAPICVHL